MRRKKDWISILGMIGTALGLLAPLLSDWARDKEYEDLIEEKVKEALSEQNEGS